MVSYLRVLPIQYPYTFAGDRVFLGTNLGNLHIYNLDKEQGNYLLTTV
jgi:hypothetical protein